MKRTAALVVLAGLLLAGCQDAYDGENDRYHFCIEHGGSFHSDDDSFECKLPAEPGGNR